MPRTRPKNLPWLTPSQTEEAESLIKKSQLDPNVCPTCQNVEREIDGVTDWWVNTYRLDEENHICDCDTQRSLLRHYVLAHIPIRYITYSAEDWEGDQKAFEEILDYLDDWKQHHRDGTGIGIYCKGLGRGKTFLATYVARDLVRRGESVIFIHFEEVLQLYSMPFEYRHKKEECLKNSGVLVLDEVSNPTSDSQRDFYAREFENLIRYRSHYNKATIFTTNLEPEDLEKKYPRVFSLLTDSSLEIRVGQEVDEDFRHQLRDKKISLKKKGEVKPIC